MASPIHYRKKCETQADRGYKAWNRISRLLPKWRGKYNWIFSSWGHGGIGWKSTMYASCCSPCPQTLLGLVVGISHARSSLVCNFVYARYCSTLCWKTIMQHRACNIIYQLLLIGLIGPGSESGYEPYPETQIMIIIFTIQATISTKTNYLYHQIR